jgi:RNA polymerase sigma-70 factor (ECF subfamily)
MQQTAAHALSTSVGDPSSASPPRERFENIFRRDARAILAYALRRTDRPEDAADVVSEVMLIAWRRIGDVPEDPEARLWLYGVARRVLANQRRSSRRRAALGDRLRSVVASEFAEDLADAHMRQAAVREGLNALPEADREVLLLTAWEGLDANEVGVVMSVTPSAVRSRIHRARTRLRAELEDELNTAPKEGS